MDLPLLLIGRKDCTALSDCLLPDIVHTAAIGLRIFSYTILGVICYEGISLKVMSASVHVARSTDSLPLAIRFCLVDEPLV